MSKTLIAPSGLVTYEMKVDGQVLPATYSIVSINIRREVNKIGVAKIRVLDGGYTGLEEDFKASNSELFDPGKKVEISVGYHSDNVSIYKGIVVKHGLKLQEGNTYLYIECKEEAIKMTVARKNAVFIDKKDSDIISEIIKANGLTAKVEASTVQHAEVVQYYCSDWDFMMMRADLNGQFIITEGDKVTVSKPADAASVVEVVNGTSMISFNAEIDSKNQFTKVSSVGWDVANQKIVESNSKPVDDLKIGLSSSKLSDVHGVPEFHLQSNANLPPNLLEAWATGKLTRSKFSQVQGTVRFIGSDLVKPGVFIDLKGLSKSFNGKAYVSAVNQIVEEGDWITEAQLGVTFKSYSEEMPDIEAPSASGMIPGIKGLITAIVKKIHEDKDGQHRIQISYPTLDKDNLGIWARLSTFYATNGSGSFFIPEIGDEVIVGFINEDPQHPVILGSLYSSKNAPPFTSEEKNKMKALVTKSLMKISFDEEKKIISIETPAKNMIVLDDDQGSITFTDKNNNKIEMTKDGMTFDCAKDFTVKAKGKIVMEATGDITMKATGNLKGEGMEVGLKGSTKFAAEGAMAEVKGSAQTVIKGGIVMIN
jgi:Rhs element Vgr protein